jgi:hypothetical protein
MWTIFFVATQGRFFYGRLGGAMKSKSPPPPFKKGGEKAPDFFNSKTKHVR